VEEHWEELKKRKEEQYKSKQEQVRKGDGLERGGFLNYRDYGKREEYKEKIRSRRNM
jgi:hypothetical protein